MRLALVLPGLSPKDRTPKTSDERRGAVGPHIPMLNMSINAAEAAAVESLASRIASRRQQAARRRELESPRAWEALVQSLPTIEYAWNQLPEDLLRHCLRHICSQADDVSSAAAALLSVGRVCHSWNKAADSNELWAELVHARWPETAGLEHVPSYKFLHFRMAKADRGVAIREWHAPDHELCFMVRIMIDGTPSHPQAHLALAHTFKWSEVGDDGAWAVPPLTQPEGKLNDWVKQNQLTGFRDFCEDYCPWNLTVTAFRALDGRISRLIPTTTADLPSQYCADADYANMATFVGYEERVADRSFVLGAQLIPTASLPEVESTEVGGYDASALEQFLTGLRLRLGYWPALFYNDPDNKTTDWQRHFVANSGNTEFATLVHCLLEVNSV
jgi:hypothetical protein